MEKPGSWTYRGVCETCGKYYKVENQTVVDDPVERLRDAAMMINHEHSYTNGHVFNGSVECVLVPPVSQPAEDNKVLPMHQQKHGRRNAR